MTFKFNRGYLFLIFVSLTVGCGSLTYIPNSTEVVKDNESKANYNPEVKPDRNTYKINGKPVKRVDRVCIPWYTEDGDRFIRKLGPNEYLYIINGEYIIGPRNNCRCMPNTIRILTSQGEKQIDNIQIGDSVYTFNNNDGKILAPIIQVNKIPVHCGYTMIKITLENGKSIQASLNHPIPIERNYASSSGNQYEVLLFSDIKKGDHIGNSIVVSIEFVNYNGGFTYDILPAGESGYYWADGVLVGSTLFQNYVSEIEN